MTTTNVDRLVEELCKYISEKESDAFYSNSCEEYAEWLDDGSEHKDFLREKLTSALSQARQEGRKEAVNYIKDNMMFGRDISKNLVFDPNEFTDLLVAALTTEGK